MNLGQEQLIEANTERQKEKELKIQEVYTLIDEWETDKSKEIKKYNGTKKFGQISAFEKITNFLIDLGKINSAQDFGKKIKELKEKGYSLDVIAQAINRYVKNRKIEEEVELHKQNISRIIKKQNKSAFIL